MQSLFQNIAKAALQPSYLDRLPINKNGRIMFVKTADIQWIESAGNSVRLHIASGNYSIHETLSRLEQKLNPKEFVRIHRSTIVNLHFVKEVHPWFHGYHVVLLDNGRELRLSRYQRQVAERLGVRKPHG